jgi:hypothetical protein
MLLCPQKSLDGAGNQTRLEHLKNDDEEEKPEANAEEQNGPMHGHFWYLGNLARYCRGTISHVGRPFIGLIANDDSLGYSRDNRNGTVLRNTAAIK